MTAQPQLATLTPNNHVWTNVATTGTSSNIAFPTTMGTASTTNGMVIVSGTAAQMMNNALQNSMMAQLNGVIRNQYLNQSGRTKIDSEMSIELPDGAIIDVKADGSYQIIDADATVKYKANPLREFNRYINASDLLEEFIDFVADVGQIDKQGFLALPVELFIRWLIIRAAEADGDEAPEDVGALRQQLALPSPQKTTSIKPHCRHCGRFVEKKKAMNGLLFCSAEHYEGFEAKVCA